MANKHRQCECAAFCPWPGTIEVDTDLLSDWNKQSKFAFLNSKTARSFLCTRHYQKYRKWLKQTNPFKPDSSLHDDFLRSTGMKIERK